MGILYIVATPIGNLQDISFRALEILQKVDAIACEDTRKTGILLKMLTERFPAQYSNGTRPRLISYYEQNENQRIPEIIDAIKNGLNIALVSDAGTPTISDPGFRLIRQAVQEGVMAESVPGPCAAIVALTLSGLPTDKFLFLGYLPRKEGNRKKLLEKTKEALELVRSTVIIFEAPHRLIKVLGDLKEAFGDIDIVITRELTKIHEEIRREKISEALAHFSETQPKGEFVILFNLKEWSL